MLATNNAESSDVKPSHCLEANENGSLSDSCGSHTGSSPAQPLTPESDTPLSPAKRKRSLDQRDTFVSESDDSSVPKKSKLDTSDAGTGLERSGVLSKEDYERVSMSFGRDLSVFKDPEAAKNIPSILTPNPRRYVTFPIEHWSIWDMYKKHLASFWTVDEIDLEKDKPHWKSVLKDDEKMFIKYVLAFFAASDGIVSENLALRMYKDVQAPEARSFYSMQIQIEHIHSEMYSLLIDVFAENPEEKKLLFNAIQNLECVKIKADWAIRWMGSDASFEERLVAFAAVEGIFFSSSFCSIFWLKKRGVMPGLSLSNEFISRDEGLHRDFACMLYTDKCRRLKTEVVAEIIRSAVNCERVFVESALKVDVIGINSRLMMQYVEFVADHLLVSLGEEKIYNTANPFDWMELISLQGKSNFFEKRVSEYQKSGVMLGDKNTRVFTTDEDF